MIMRRPRVLLGLLCWCSGLLGEDIIAVDGFSFLGVNSSINRRTSSGGGGGGGGSNSGGIGDNNREEGKIQHSQHHHHPRIPRSSSSVAAADINNNNKSSHHHHETTTTSPASVVRLALLVSENSQSSLLPATTSSLSSSSSSSTTSSTPPSLSPFEITCVTQMEEWYRRALKMKCPFFRRRASDMLDAADMIMRFLIIRHKSLDLLGPPPGHRCHGKTCHKSKGLSIAQTMDIIRNDWRTDTNKGYYITGKLNTTIYRDDCLFDGPDPDMPVKGLRKYLNAASQLFDQGKSRSQLLSLDVVVDDNNNNQNTIVATWKMNGILRLPWSPKLPTWTGTTTYHRDDEDGLIYLHTETWDMSVLQAFLRTFWPSLARRIWCSNNGSMSLSPDNNEIMEECLIPYDD